MEEEVEEVEEEALPAGVRTFHVDYRLDFEH